MPIKTIDIKGKNVDTLKELLRPGLRAVFVGINPTPIAVDCGHYYQGRLGKRFWRRLQDEGFTPDLPEGKEDEVAFREDFGFADLVRRLTKGAKNLSSDELHEGANQLLQHLLALGEPRPAVVFVFKKAAEMSETILQQAGFQIYRMPAPYVRKEDEKRTMLLLANQIARSQG